MKVLVFDGLPAFAQANSSEAQAISGTTVYHDQVARALLQYGSYDRYYFLSRNPFSPDLAQVDAELASRYSRAGVLSPCQLAALRGADDVVLFSATPFIAGMIPLRSNPDSSRWIVSGIVHSIDHADIPGLALALLHSDVDAADSLICSSIAGRTVLQNIFQRVWLRGNRASPPAPISMPVIPLGIDCSSDANDEDPGNEFIVLYLGRFSPVSKCDLVPLIAAFARVARSRPRMQLVLAGDDRQHRMAEFLVSCAQALGCGDHVAVHANIQPEEKARLLRAASVFVSPADHIQETFGLSIVEAMAAGLPVIASDWNGYKDLVVDGETGFRVRTTWLNLKPELDLMAGNSFFLRNSALAAATSVDMGEIERVIGILYDSPDLRMRMGRAARSRALQFEWSSIIPRYETLWSEDMRQARVLRRDGASFGWSAIHYEAQEIFSHYPTQTLFADEPLRITEEGRAILTSGDCPIWAVSPIGFIDGAHMKLLLDIAAASEALTISNLARRLAQAANSPQFIAMTHVAAALKYGFVRLCE